MPDIRANQPSSFLLGLDALASIRKDALTYYEDLHLKYGDAVKVRLGPYKCWFLFHPIHIEQVLAKQADQFIRFEKIMNVLRQWNGESLMIVEGQSWKDRRRKALPAFKRQRMPEYASTIINYAYQEAQNWKSKTERDGSHTIDVDEYMAQYALDVAGLTLFSQTLGSYSQSAIKAVHALSEIAYLETTAPFNLPDFLPLKSKQHKKWAVSTMKELISDIVQTRLNDNQSECTDLLNILIEHHAHDIEEIEQDVMSLLIAGHETSGATLTWLFLLLAKHPSVLESVQTELHNVIGDSEVRFEHLKSLPYLTAVTQETMRLYPAAYALFARRATDDVSLDGVQIQKGDLVQLLPYITHRDERWFTDPKSFKPERFLNDENVNQYTYFPFGAGPRVCIGQSFGMMEVMLSAAVFLKSFTIKSIEEELEASPRFSLRPASEYRLVLKCVE